MARKICLRMKRTSGGLRCAKFGNVGGRMGALSGPHKFCIRFRKSKKTGVLRCAEFAKGSGSPVFDRRLVDAKTGGRSPGLVRPCYTLPHGCRSKIRKARRTMKAPARKTHSRKAHATRARTAKGWRKASKR
jgi:hypothetical protein